MDSPWPEDIRLEEERRSIAESSLVILQRQGYSESERYGVDTSFAKALLAALNKGALRVWEEMLVGEEEEEAIVRILHQNLAAESPLQLSVERMVGMIDDIDDCFYEFHGCFHQSAYENNIDAARENDPAAMLNCSSSCIGRENPQEAFYWLSRLLEQSKGRYLPHAHMNLCNLYAKTGDNKGAIKECQQALDSTESVDLADRILISIVLAGLYLRVNQPVDAARHATSALSMIAHCLEGKQIDLGGSPGYCSGEGRPYVAHCSFRSHMDNIRDVFVELKKRRLADSSVLTAIESQYINTKRIMISHSGR